MRTMLVVLMALCLVSSFAVAKPDPGKPIPQHLSNSRAAEVEPNDDYLTANTLTVGDDMSAAIDPAGDVDFYAITVDAGDVLAFETAPGDVGDTKLYLFDTDGVTQLAYNDDIGYPNYYSHIDYTFAVAGTYFVEVTGYSASTAGTYFLVVTEEEPPPPPPANDDCAGAIDLHLQGLQSFEVDLCLYTNLYTPGGYGTSCTGFGANGPEAVYMIDLGVGEAFSACVEPLEGVYMDLALYLITDCADAETSCVAGDDSGNPECIDFTADVAGTYYLMVDTYSSCGGGTCLVTIGAPVANEDLTWGAVKSLYE